MSWEDRWRRLDRWNPDVVLWLVIANLVGFAISMHVSLSTLALGGKQAWGPSPFATNLCGAASAHYVLEGQWYRVVTACFLHANLLHLALNVIALYMLGRPIAFLIGLRRTTILYLAAGITSFVVSMSWRYVREHVVGGLDVHNVGTSVGASGAVFGLFCYLIGMTFGTRDPAALAQRRTLLIWLVINVAYGLQPGSPVDNAAHAGGGLLGFGLALAEGRRPLRWITGAARSRVTLVVLLAVALAAIVHALVAYHGEFGRRYRTLMEAVPVYHDALEIFGDFEKANERTDGPPDGRPLLRRLRDLEAEAGKLAERPDLRDVAEPVRRRALVVIGYLERRLPDPQLLPAAEADFNLAGHELARTLGRFSSLRVRRD